MPLSSSRKRKAIFLLSLCLVTAVGLGCFCGAVAATTRNIQRELNVGEYRPALPSVLLDRSGKLITEFFSDQKREIVPIQDLPKYLIYAVITKEDRNFFHHHGFSIRGILRAAWNDLAGHYFSGGSTISQVVAGNLYEDRSVSTVARKLKELWWSLQLEKKRSKQEILQLYLDSSPFGHGTYGVEAASQFYFGHSARDVTLAEAAMLAVPLSSKSLNSPIAHPNRARKIQKEVLDAMVSLGYADADAAEASYDEFWATFDVTRPDNSSAYAQRADNAPYFSEYVKREFEELPLDSYDLYRDGLVIHTTLDLAHQREAERLMDAQLKKLNTQREQEQRAEERIATERFLAPLSALSLLFSVPQLDLTSQAEVEAATKRVRESFLSALDSLSLLTGIAGLRYSVDREYVSLREEQSRQTIEGAFVSLDNDTGGILAMVGGDGQNPAFNRVVDLRPRTGSAVAPLYIAGAIDDHSLTTATMFEDSPQYFTQADGSLYIPWNHLPYWRGPVSLRDAVADSLDVPLAEAAQRIGIPGVIGGIASFLNMESQKNDTTLFPRSYDISVGRMGVSPLRMAEAYVVFPDGGRPVEPFAISYIEDRHGNVIYDNKREVLRRLSREKSVISPQAAFLMTDMLESTVKDGNISRRITELAGVGGIPLAAKTGTSANWGDAWTVGSSPFFTAAVWFGFDVLGSSLGEYQTGALDAGPVWAQYMKDMHRDLPPRQFPLLPDGIIERQVCSVSGQLPSQLCDQGISTEYFIAGTEPKTLCTLHPYKASRDKALIRHLSASFMLEPTDSLETGLPAVPSSENAEEGRTAGSANPLLP